MKGPGGSWFVFLNGVLSNCPKIVPTRRLIESPVVLLKVKRLMIYNAMCME